MPITVCEKHGESGCLEMCKHLYKNLEKGVFLPFYTLPVYTIRMCTKCFEKYNMQELVDTLSIDKKEVQEKKEKETGFYKIAPDYYFESAVLNEKNPKLLEKIKYTYHKINKKSRFKCQDCIDDIYFEYAKKNNLELPFEPFENTILHSDDKRIFKLENKINKYFGVKELDITKCSRTCEIWSGSIRCPLLIKIYGATTQKEQDKIVKLIDKFFKKIPQKQRKVIFYEPLTWIVEKSEKGTKRIYRDKTKILSEVVVRE
ncbi:hypothetical protein Fleli_1290 [Bernardetia litoralis DSM 6794]|uniref:Uncharacterized protein n=1 Tax=Bernardetia litoralis (strain ATCC 23117 / DSM 6794 / NBRC 15988 / NCIMB 1366 / Fx l1 / Sio-4) TaxID=880071 RepID=I4AID9_BERLS|nr:hypothetical protein [Bernardetia litoralis]AFM03724.1 hypothetical protein Fleli_1290 [Bernardetia litoralis DSM 6794]